MLSEKKNTFTSLFFSLCAKPNINCTHFKYAEILFDLYVKSNYNVLFTKRVNADIYTDVNI